MGFNLAGILSLRSDFEVYWISAESKPVTISNDDYHHLRDFPGFNFDGSDKKLDEVILFVRLHAITIYETYSRHWVTGRQPLPIPEFEVLLYSHIYWAFNLIEKFKPEAIFFLNLPHEGFDNVLQYCAESMGIRVFCFYNIPFAPFHWIIGSGKDLNLLPTSINEGAVVNSISQEQIDLYIFQFMLRCAGIGKHWYMGGDPYNMPSISLDYVLEHINSKTQDLKSKNSAPRYVYFPLHLQPELTTALLGRNYSNQLYAIKRAAEWAAGNGWHLLVKENPIQGISHRGPFFWEAFATIPNVTLVENNVSSQELIASAECVVTITGTAGIEGLILGKPVICLGDIYYKNFKGIFGHFPDAGEINRHKAPTVLDIYQNLLEITNCSSLGANDIDFEKFFKIENKVNNLNLNSSIKREMDKC